ncbi:MULTISPECIES: hypothetical protein [unclassified Chelatococcus]|uniref:hypothetical protein n=1 Tax=unclassified Chelatococcus TaxID=2638111 RepID=UPI001BCF8883|nr:MULTISPECIES: hypothetical protein [unclassified Chelatococcus]MBS7695766.1 hypothetical protein [Chelatococcus sp. YT9]MBX3555859.1 hypothetical protein [Chelatococcus sp.]
MVVMARDRHIVRPALRSGAIALAVGLMLAGCSSSSGTSSGGTSVGNFLLYGGATVPPEAAVPEYEVVCPKVDITEGGSAIRVGGENPRYQVSITDVARECTMTGGGGYQLKIGVEALALLGSGGNVGRVTVPVHFTVKRGNTVVANRTRTTAVAFASGETQTAFTVVEDGIDVPAGEGEVTIMVGLGSAPAQARTGGRRR